MSSPKVHIIRSSRVDTYENKVIQTYDDAPEAWHKALGDNLSFQFGLFDQEEIAQGPKPGPVGPSEFRHLQRQLELAGLTGPTRPRIKRILDLGCGWGFTTQYLAEQFPECGCVDAINISERQLQYCSERLPINLIGRVNFYLCNGQDVDLLPNPEALYDLVLVRGVYTHFLHPVFEASVHQVAGRLGATGTLIISDTLYQAKNLDIYRSPILDVNDRLACANRKTPEYFADALRQAGLQIEDMRILPSNEEVIHWFKKVRLNIEQNFPGGATGAIKELHEMAQSFSDSLARNKASVYSIVAQRRGQ